MSEGTASIERLPLAIKFGKNKDLLARSAKKGVYIVLFFSSPRYSVEKLSITMSTIFFLLAVFFSQLLSFCLETFSTILVLHLHQTLNLVFLTYFLDLFSQM